MDHLSEDQIQKEEIRKWDQRAAQSCELDWSATDILNRKDLIWRRIHNLAYDLCGRDLTGKKVLDLGCGYGNSTIILAGRGARVTALDISPGMVDLAMKRAAHHGLNHRVTPYIGNIRELAGTGRQFDVIFAGAVLHHLIHFEQDIQLLAAITKAGGRMVSYDPFGSPLFNFARRHLPYQDKHRSSNEWPLNAANLKMIEKAFGRVTVYRYSIGTAVERVVGMNSPMVWKALTAIDRVFDAFGDLFCWHVICKAQKV